jgi:GH43 family beta-xylosidase
MNYRQLFWLSATVNITTAVFLLEESNNEQVITREVERCKICSNMDIKDLKSARNELHISSLQVWYKKQIDRRNSNVASAILNGDWTPGQHVPEILTPQERQLPAFQALFKQDTNSK